MKKPWRHGERPDDGEPPSGGDGEDEEGQVTLVTKLRNATAPAPVAGTRALRWKARLLEKKMSACRADVGAAFRGERPALCSGHALGTKLPIQSFRQVAEELGRSAQVSIFGREAAELLTAPRQLLVLHILPRSIRVASSRGTDSVKKKVGNEPRSYGRTHRRRLTARAARMCRNVNPPGRSAARSPWEAGRRLAGGQGGKRGLGRSRVGDGRGAGNRERRAAAVAGEHGSKLAGMPHSHRDRAIRTDPARRPIPGRPQSVDWNHRAQRIGGSRAKDHAGSFSIGYSTVTRHGRQTYTAA